MKSYTYKALGTNGRLGNQLWQIAWQIGSATKDATLQDQVCVNPDWEYRKYFSIHGGFFSPPEHRIFDGGTLYYQELHHWSHATGLVYDNFQPSQFSVNYLESNYPDWFFDKSVNKTSIHVRAGDYLSYPTRFPVPSNKYYDSAIEMAGDSKLVVFSDDIGYAKSKLDKLNRDIYYVDGVSRPVEPHRRKGEPEDQWDMFLMTFCEKHIIANSTFSWWGAYLADRTDEHEVYYPSVWFGPDTDARDSRGIDIRKSWVDGIPKKWRKVEC